MEIDFPHFVPPETPQVVFPFFAPNGESFLTLLDRDDVVKEINGITRPVLNDRNMRRQKYWPIIISTSRGMGKTFLLKMIGMQKVEEKLKNVLIQDAIACGRVLSFDFSRNSDAIKRKEDIDVFLPSLMIYFLCLIFDGTQVDGINFTKIERFETVPAYVGSQKKFNEWKKSCFLKSADGMMDEYMRLTNISFSVDPNTDMYTTPPVFLFDKVQQLCETTDTPSSFKSGIRRYHTLLSLMLTKFSLKHRPICIITLLGNALKLMKTRN